MCSAPVHFSFSDEAGGFVEVELEIFLELVEGRRERVDGRGRLDGSIAVLPVQLTRHQLSSYSAAILGEFQRCLRGIRAHLREGSPS